MKKLFYGWIVVIGCMLICACGMGIVTNTMGTFIKPVSEALCVTRSQVSLYGTIVSITCMLMAPVQGRIISRGKIKWIMLWGAVFTGVFLFSYSFAQSVWMFYFIAAGCGLSVGFMNTIPVNQILSNWFIERKGTAQGIALAGSGLCAMLVTPVLSRLIQQYGWRQGYRFLSLLFLAVTVPVIILILYDSPADRRTVPLGWTDDSVSIEKTGYTCQEVMRTKTFWMLLPAMFLSTISCMGTQQHLLSYLTDMGYGNEFASTIFSLSMGVLIAGKIILGMLYDKVGICKTSIYLCAMYVISAILLLLIRIPGIPCLFILSFGMANAIQSVPGAYLVSYYFGNKDYSSIYGICNSCNMAGIALGTTVSAVIYDFTGTYRIAWIIYIAVSAAVLLLHLGAYESHVKRSAGK